MTQEEKAKAYDKALEIARKINSGEGVAVPSDWTICETIFPELKESEDEKIRKWLITQLELKSDVNNPHGLELMILKSIDWLEKQREPINEEKVLIGARKDVALSIMNFLDKCTLGMRLSNMERADLESAVVNSDWSKVYDYMKKKLEGQCEQKPQGKSAFETINEKKVDNATKFELKNYNGIDKPEVEPKFKVGDWIVSKTSNLVYYVDSILFPQSKCYFLSHNGGIVLVNFADEQNYRLWTIEDAKDGDILAVENMVFVYKTVLASHIVSYCKLFNNKFEHFNDIRTCCEKNSKVHPATKEQRDALMKAMADAGYTFDFEKKKLKKIEQK